LSSAVLFFRVGLFHLHFLSLFCKYWANSQAMDIYQRPDSSQLQYFPFQICKEITYLGVKICPNLPKIASMNMDYILKDISKDVERWYLLPLSFLGRIEIAKINIYPKMTYIISLLPLKFSFLLFARINRLIVRFYGIKNSLACHTRPLKIGLPDVYIYYLAFQMCPNFKVVKNIRTAVPGQTKGPSSPISKTSLFTWCQIMWSIFLQNLTNLCISSVFEHNSTFSKMYALPAIPFDKYLALVVFRNSG
uniref:Maturase K n=1 Tax=Chelonoidis abingdonii TaxID=106734 RepID=A0A8C0G7V6_CHEAB